MNGVPEYFGRIAGQINVSLLATQRVVVVGLGAVGSPIAEHLAKSGVGSLLFIDGDLYEEANRVRHVLPPDYLGQNKANAMRLYLLREKIPGLQVQALARYIEQPMSSDELDQILDAADLIIVATGERPIQRWLGERALALDIPAIFPALYPDGGGEVFIQTSPRRPCFFCWDGWRGSDEPVRGAEAPGVATMPVIQTAIELSLGALDPGSSYEELTRPDNDDLDRQDRNLFLLLPNAPRNPRLVPRVDGCPACQVGPSSLRPEAREAWEAAERERMAIPAPSVSRPTIPPVEEPALPSEVIRSVRRRSGVTNFVGNLASLALALVFFAAPYGVMRMVSPAHNAHPGIGWDLVVLLCVAWWFAGIGVVFKSVINLFSRY